MQNLTMTLTVLAKRALTDEITEFTLADPAGAALPGFTAGSHLHAGVPSGGTRQYSLANDPAETHRYVIAVKREAGGRGGSVSLVDGVAQGDTLRVSAPRNDFELDLTASGEPLLIAGGIGITPILCMARALHAAGRPFRMVYLTRDAAQAAYADEIAAAPFAGSVTMHHDGGDPARAFDLAGALADPAGRTIYCCGPTGLLHAVRNTAAHWPRGSVRFEDFGTAPLAAGADSDSFWVRMEGEEARYRVPADRSILQVLQEAGLDVPSSCEAGTCGTCRMRLVSGEADHRDLVLFDDEMEDNIIICCSRAKSDELVIAPLG